MVRAEWTELGRVIGAYRSKVVASKPLGDTPTLLMAQMEWAGQLAAIDAISRVLVRYLRRRSGRFDARKFLALCGTSFDEK